MAKLTSLPKSNSHIAWCPACKDEFMTYNLALAKCPRCGGSARTGVKRFAVRAATTLLVVLAVLVLLGAGAYLVLRGRGLTGEMAEPPQAAEAPPAEAPPAG